MSTAARIAKVLLVLTIGIILWLALHPSPPIAGLQFDKFNHLAAFFVLALLAEYAFPSGKGEVLKLLPLLGFGMLIEMLQYWVDYRYFEWLDLIADASGIVLFWLVRGALRRTFDPLLKKALGA